MWEKNIHWLLPRLPPSLCPDQVFKLRPSGAWEDAPTTLDRAQRVFLILSYDWNFQLVYGICKICFCKDIQELSYLQLFFCFIFMFISMSFRVISPWAFDKNNQIRRVFSPAPWAALWKPNLWAVDVVSLCGDHTIFRDLSEIWVLVTLRRNCF